MTQLTTTAVKAGIEADKAFGAVTPPLYLSSNYTFEGFAQPRQYDYTRSGNPTRDLLADALAELEGGAGGVITSTGMSAILLVTHLLKAGDTLIAPHDCYGGTYRLFKNLSDKGHFDIRFVDQNDPIAIQSALSKGAKLLWVETPSNPLLRVVDIQRLSELAKQHDCLVAVDNTFLTPIYQKPFELGADIVVHSTTKYINGHSDVVGGAAIAKTEELHEQLCWWANCLGITASPFDSLLTLRGLRTLGVRLQQHEANTETIIDFLSHHPQVDNIYHPSLSSHEGHAIASKQQSGFGIMLSFELKGDEEEIKAFLSALKHFSLAESLGGVESLICHPATMTHAAMDKAAQITAGIKPNLLRLSVGIEDSKDLIDDLKQAFLYAQQCQYQRKVS
ncbi:cystathionine gamma-synthase [Pleionea sp. CnH1-48]|uniref:cystathionine gamma-synthase n=1 Tax=Pleionea sp. CnH1-48 TaxID=2954494 RepID=UPI002097887B|nr:cystathionine gamma-synthase [Pleionea sp. CnH1-48]MCO7224422.1 cystathionine gamma-synthase [Pleionea sp. CnH1-48]